nr:hypothetical protein [Angustibacter aerolatus]
MALAHAGLRRHLLAAEGRVAEPARQQQAEYIRGEGPATTFDDTKSYWSPVTPQSSVKVRNAGVTMKILEQSGTSLKVEIGSKAPSKG